MVMKVGGVRVGGVRVVKKFCEIKMLWREIVVVLYGE